MKNKIKFNFSRYTDSDLETKAGAILQSMTGNPNFPSPIPTLAELQTALTNYSNALVNAADLGKLNVATKNQCRQTLELLLGQLGMYVMYIANGNAVILTSSGYSLAKEPEPIALENPGSITLSNGITSGQLVATVKSVPGAKGYLHQITPDPMTPQSQWVSTASTRSKKVYNDLQPGQKYWVRIVAVGTEEQLAYSPESSMYVQ